MKKGTKKKLKTTKYTVTPSGREEAPDGMASTPDGRGAVPSGRDYLGVMFEEVQEILSLKNPVREGFAPDGMKRSAPDQVLVVPSGIKSTENPGNSIFALPRPVRV